MEEKENNGQLFDETAREEWERIPEKVAARIKNIALLVEDEPSEETRVAEGLAEGDTLFGLYHGIPLTERGVDYGIGETLPDTITLYRLPILEEARADGREDALRLVIRETIWHEIAHYFGFDEPAVLFREDEGTNAYRS